MSRGRSSPAGIVDLEALLFRRPCRRIARRTLDRNHDHAHFRIHHSRNRTRLDTRRTAAAEGERCIAGALLGPGGYWRCGGGLWGPGPPPYCRPPGPPS